MTDKQKKAAYLDWANRYCNECWKDEYVDPDTQETVPSTIPPGVEMILCMLVDYNNSRAGGIGVTSESMEGLSTSYGDADIPKEIMTLIKPYRRLRW